MSDTETDTEPVLSHPDYEFANKRYRHKATGQFASKADVEKALETAKMAEHIKIRLPTWNPAKPKLWFKACERIFKLAKVPDTEQETKATLILREFGCSAEHHRAADP